MGMTVGELCDRMDSLEFTQWLAYAGVEPFGSPVDDLRAGTIATAAIAVGGVAKSPGDWFRWTPPEPLGGWKELKAAMGGRVAKK